MALVRLGPVVQAISGTIGGTTFVRRGPRTIARRRQGFRRKTSAVVLARQARMAVIRSHWQTLTSLQRDAWQTYARTILRTNRLGTTTSPTAYIAYVQYHFAAVDPVPPWRTEPPDLAMPKSPEALTLNFTCGGPWTLSIEPTPWDATDYLLMFLARSHSDSPLRVLHYYRYVGGMSLFLGKTIDVRVKALPILGELVAGEHVHARVHVYRVAGGRGPGLTATGTVQCP